MQEEIITVMTNKGVVVMTVKFCGTKNSIL